MGHAESAGNGHRRGALADINRHHQHAGPKTHLVKGVHRAHIFGTDLPDVDMPNPAAHKVSQRYATDEVGSQQS